MKLATLIVAEFCWETTRRFGDLFCFTLRLVTKINKWIKFPKMSWNSKIRPSVILWNFWLYHVFMTLSLHNLQWLKRLCLKSLDLCKLRRSFDFIVSIFLSAIPTFTSANSYIRHGFVVSRYQNVFSDFKSPASRLFPLVWRLPYYFMYFECEERSF